MSDFHSERILVIAIRSIGDVVLITPLLSQLKKRHPHATLTILVDGPSSQVLANNPHLDKLIVINRALSKQSSWHTRWRQWVNLVLELRRQQFDRVIDLFSGPRSAILGFLTGASERYGEDFSRKIRGMLYNYPISIIRDGRHLIEQKHDLLRPLLGAIDSQELMLELFLTEQERSQGKKILGIDEKDGVKRIGLIPSAGSRWRVWPAERFADVADALVEMYGTEIVLLGGLDDSSICRQIAERMKHKPLDLSGKTTLRELMAVLMELDLVIANVTGPMHLAVALSRPKVIGLYGAADTVQYSPWGSRGIMMTKGMPHEAYWYKVDYQRDFEVLCKITVEDVLEMVKSVYPEKRMKRSDAS